MGNTRKEKHWVLQAQSGDLAALDNLLKSVEQPLYQYIVSLVTDTNAAQDILQEALLIAFRICDQTHQLSPCVIP